MSVERAYQALTHDVAADVALGERLSQRTSYRIGGPAALSVTPHTYAALAHTIEVLEREEVEWVVLGRGTNVLVADAGYEGCVIRLGKEFSRVSFGMEDEDRPDGTAVAGAGVQLSKLLLEAQRLGLSGLEPLTGIPGTVGGAVSMNAGTRREWIGSVVSSVVTLRPGEGLVRYEGSEIDWGYRGCSIPGWEIILEASFVLEPTSPAEVAHEMERRHALRREKQPIGVACCGSVFRNPPEGSAGALVESCGLKGFTAGRAQVSEVHANFVVNTGGATASDVLTVLHRMHDEVYARHGIDLVPEVKFLGFA